MGLAAIPHIAIAQIGSAGLSGVVSDPTESNVAGVTVDLTHSATNRSFQETTDSRGVYRFVALPVGRYRVRVQFAGFKTLEREIELTVNQLANLNLRMEIGETTETVNVTAAAPVTNATTSTVGTVIEQRAIMDLPLNGRNFAGLISLTPGVAVTDVSQGGAGPSIQGQRNRNNSYVADGVSISRISFGNIAISPPLDSVQEFRVQSVNGEAEFGQYSGGFVNLVTKSGTDQFHGTAYDYVRNNALDARHTFQAAIPAYRYNQFGFSLGGPVFVPKLHSRKPFRTWFFVSYEGLRQRQNSSTLSRVPTEAQLQGNFSGLPTIYDPFSTRVDPANASRYLRDAFPGNQIPGSMLNPLAARYAAEFLPRPNISLPGSVNNFINGAPASTDRDTWMGKIDHSINSNHRVSFRWLQADVVQGNALPVGNGLLNGTFQAPRNASAEWNAVLAPALILTARYGYGRTDVDTRSPQVPGFYESSGYNNPNGYPINTPGLYLLPAMTISGYGSFLPQGSSPETVTTHSGSIDLQKIWGRHAIKVGFNIDRPSSYNGGLTPTELFNVAQTQNLISPTGTGDAMASFLLGVPSGGFRLVGSPFVNIDGWFYGAYVQDTVRVNSSLSLNFGLRWDFAGQFTSDGVLGAFDQRGGGWLLTAPVNIPNTRFQGPNVRPGIFDPVWTNFGPRAGLAYTMTPKTVFRAGYGIYFDTVAGRWQWVQAPRVSWPRAQSQDAPPLNTIFPTVAMDRPFVGLPSTPYLPSPFVTDSGATSYPTGSQPNPILKTPRSHQFNIALERQISNALVVSATYVGAIGRKLDCCGLINQSYTNQAGSYNSSARPFPQMGVFRTNRNDGYSGYHSLQVKAEQRFSAGLAFLASYTYSKSTDLACSGYIGAEGCNITQPYAGGEYKYAMDHALSDFDLRHIGSLAVVYELPFGKNKRFAPENPFLNFLVEGWQLSGILSLRTGRPLTPVLANTAQTNIGSGVAPRPNLTGSIEASDPNRFRWFNTDAFATPSGFTYGNAGRNILQGPSYHNEDLSLFRNFQILSDRLRIQLRGEFFNAFNATRLANPNLSLGNVQFGTISSASPGRSVQIAMKIIF